MNNEIVANEISENYEVDIAKVNPTKKIFYFNPYIVESNANIVAIINEKDYFKIILDETIFYPEGGGQPSDNGEINGIEVFDIKEKDGLIYHFVNELPKSKKVKCKIDFNRRFDYMQQHSGEHVLSGVLLKLFSAANKGFHIGEHYVTIDINIKDMTEEMLTEAENQTNKYIYENQKVEQIMTDMEGLKVFPIRKEITAEEDIRVVTIGEADCCACCGTHVKTLGEVGIVKIIKSESYKGMTRLYFLCGKRALHDYTCKNDIVNALKKELSSEEHLINSKIIKLKEDNNSLKRQLDNIKKQLAITISNSISSQEIITIIYDDIDFEVLTNIESELIKKAETVVLATKIDKKILTLTKNNDLNLGQFFKENISSYNGKGGGSNSKAQGNFAEISHLEGFYTKLISKL